MEAFNQVLFSVETIGMLALIGFPAFIGDWIFFHSCHTIKSKQSVRSSSGVILTARFACCLMAGNSILYKLPEAF